MRCKVRGTGSCSAAFKCLRLQDKTFTAAPFFSICVRIWGEGNWKLSTTTFGKGKKQKHAAGNKSGSCCCCLLGTFFSDTYINESQSVLLKNTFKRVHFWVLRHHSSPRNGPSWIQLVATPGPPATANQTCNTAEKVTWNIVCGGLEDDFPV